MEFEGTNQFEAGTSPEQQEELRQRIENAGMVFKEYIRLQEGEKVLFLSDKDTDRSLIAPLQKALEERSVPYTELVADKETGENRVAEFLDDYKVVWATCNWDQTGIDFYKLVEEKVPDKSVRMWDVMGVDGRALENDGALAERKETIDRVLGRMEERLRDVAGLHVRTVYGTDLTIQFRPGERRWYKDDGLLDPGEWENLPAGEIFTTPDEEKANGVLVLPVLQDEVTREQGVDQFVHLTIRNGKIAKIDGGDSADKLRRYLEEKSKDEENPLSVLGIAEVAFGANAKARGKVLNEDGRYDEEGVSVIEAEKRLGTMHIAFGSSQHGVEGTEGHTESDVHLDFVIPRSGLTVTAFKRYEDFHNQKKGERLINQGSWNFLG